MFFTCIKTTHSLNIVLMTIVFKDIGVDFDDNIIEPCYLVNDIGVDVDSSLHFVKHILTVYCCQGNYCRI